MDIHAQIVRSCVDGDGMLYSALVDAYAKGEIIDYARRVRKMFKSMERVYSMNPRREHCACMADLLGRSGRLNEALEFIMGMDEAASADVWAALLSSCRLHGDVQLANFAASELLKSEGEE